MWDGLTPLGYLSREWNRIERRAKEVELFRGEAVMASVNEMRYAGRRIVDYLDCMERKQETEAQSHLVVAKTYLMNADHDLTDSVIFFVHKRIDATCTKYGENKISALCPSYETMKPSIVEAHEIVQCSREERVKRSASYQKLAADYIPALMNLHKEIQNTSKLTLDDGLGILDQNVKTVKVLAAVSSVASIIGLILSIWSVYLSYNPPPPPSKLPAPASDPMKR